MLTNVFHVIYLYDVIVIQQSELSSEERSERYGPLQQHRRAVASLNKQIQQKTKQLEEVRLQPHFVLQYLHVTEKSNISDWLVLFLC